MKNLVLPTLILGVSLLLGPNVPSTLCDEEYLYLNWDESPYTLSFYKDVSTYLNIEFKEMPIESMLFHKAEIGDFVGEFENLRVNTKIVDDDCAFVEINSHRQDISAGVCLYFGTDFIYGGSELQYQRWPIPRNISLPIQPFTTNDIVPFNQSFGNVIERYWISSSGFGVYVEGEIPLFASVLQSPNPKLAPEICLFVRNPIQVTGKQLQHRVMKLHMCKTDNILETHKVMSNKFIMKPKGQPDHRMIRSPIWSTWAKYKTDINQEKVLEYAKDIVKHGFSNSQIEIDDMFSTHYGDFDFESKKFPNPSEMIAKLKELGFRITVWITPFANLDSSVFTEGMEKAFWLKDLTGEVPALVKWWQGTGAILNVDSQEAVDWYLGRLMKMKTDYGVDSFKFDAGEVNFAPPVHEHLTNWTEPTVYTTKYVAAVRKMGPMIEVRCGYRTQEFPIFVRMGDKESRWGFNNGLSTLIPTVLTMGILGYPYILPDMIGGNGYVYDADNPFTATELPGKELYIRWLPVTSYMPAMQFSFVPWQYDEEVVELSRKFVKIHQEVVSPMILEAAKVAEAEGYPIIRPLWWIAPKDLFALECETQFLIGRGFLVAPVVEEGARNRDVYLPKGLWEDELQGATVRGPKWLKGYKVELDQVATFKLLE